MTRHLISMDEKQYARLAAYPEDLIGSLTHANPTDLVEAMIGHIGDDPTREGVLETPRRVVKSWKELFGGYAQDPKAILGTTFATEGYKVDEVIICKNIELFSTCEHHLLPFFGRAHIGYIPSDRVVGLSKLARLVECYARRLQIQEKLTNQIADAMQSVLEPLAIAVVIEAEHFCMKARGARCQSSSMITSSLRGAFKDNPSARNEFLSLVKG